MFEPNEATGPSCLAGSRKMAGAFAIGGNEYGFNANFTWTAFFCCLAASSGMQTLVAQCAWSLE